MSRLRLLFAGLLALWASVSFAGNKPQVSISVGAKAPDGLYHLRYPSGNVAGPCPATSGPLTLNSSVTRSSGVSPLLVFFDSTATTDTAITGSTTVFQDVAFSEAFADTFASGTGTWAYGSGAGVNSMNLATGGIAAHLYVVTPGSGDQTFNPTISADDGTNSTSCTLAVTVYDPIGSNGFPGAATTCVSASGTPTAGSGGCPAGASVLNQSNIGTALSTAFGSNKRVLFKCGDTFTGNAVLTAVKWSIGAYGGCEGISTNRPIFNNATGTDTFAISKTSGDGRISDIDLENTTNNAIEGLSDTIRLPYQITLWNLYSNNNYGSYVFSQGAQWGMVHVVQNNAHAGHIATYFNFNQNNPTSWSGNAFNNLNYQALIGSSVIGPGSGSGSGVETVRVGACRLCVFTDDDLSNANSSGAVLKIHNGNTNGTVNTWTGVWTEYIEVSDNKFFGYSGGNLVEIAPENNLGPDERLRNIVVERNFFDGATDAWGGLQLYGGANNLTVRDNVLYMFSLSSTDYPIEGAHFGRRGSANITPQYDEIYNNTCYAPSGYSGQLCIGLDVVGDTDVAAANSVARNNLFYSTSNSGPAVNDTGSANTVSNNTPTVTANPAFTNASGTFSLISDFKPTANYTIGCTPFPSCTTVPVQKDALGLAWSPTWVLGAVHP